MTKDLYDIKNLTLDEKLGQLLMFGFEGEDVNSDTLEMIKRYKAGNVILFTRNITGAKQLFELNKKLQSLAVEHLKIPMFIGIDQEGGMVSRIQKDGTFFPGAMTISANGSLDDCYRLADYMGRELDALGVNMNFAPVLDVNNNPKNPVIGVRSFSDKPEVVSQFGEAYIKGMQNHVIATGKHFPGHGDTAVDSHLGLPTVSYGLDRLEEIEFVPFKYAINHGLKAMMSSHIHFPKLTNSGRPTTLTKDVMTDLLRNQFGFEGLIVTDGMQMKAIADNYGTVEASLMAVEAGVNIYCVCHSKDLQIQSLERIKEAVINGEIDESLIDERVNRILAYKKTLSLKILDQTYEDVEEIVGSKEAKNLSYQVVEQAASLVKGVPLKLKTKVLFVGVMPKATTIADERLGHHDMFGLIEEELPTLDFEKLPIQPTIDDINHVKDIACDYDQIIITTYNGNVYQEQIKLIEALSTLGKDIHVIALRNPYDLFYTNVIDNYVCLYEYTPNAMKVLMRYLKGELELKGKVPVAYE